MYKSLMFGDEFLAQGLHVKSHQRCSAGIRTWLILFQLVAKATFIIKLFFNKNVI